MLKHDLRVLAFTDCVPDGFAERTGPLHPATPFLAGRVRHRSPVIEFISVDDANGTLVQTELALFLVRDHCHSLAALGSDDLQSQRPKSSGGTPD